MIVTSGLANGLPQFLAARKSLNNVDHQTSSRHPHVGSKVNTPLLVAIGP